MLSLSSYLLIPSICHGALLDGTKANERKIHLKYDGILNNFHATFPFNFFLSLMLRRRLKKNYFSSSFLTGSERESILFLQMIFRDVKKS
jgi:glycopeptide antibiotics resistance protein